MRPSITLGEPLLASVYRGGLWYLYVTIPTVALALLIVLMRRLRGVA